MLLLYVVLYCIRASTVWNTLLTERFLFSWLNHQFAFTSQHEVATKGSNSDRACQNLVRRAFGAEIGMW